MTPFREWPEGRAFQTIDAGHTRFGVKLPVVTWIARNEEGNEVKETGNALFFDVMGLETVHHHKNVDHITAGINGHLARDSDGQSCIVRRVGTGEQYTAYHILPVRYKTYTRPEIALIQAKDGESEESIKQVLQTIETFESQRQKAFEYLKLLLKYHL